ncbi:MAG TPA: YbhB/YbcL family Raf kinase inhibitor-like protein [Bryobacteraceae bacterium]|nr:YbhB/YbcL family Raf kinase inhibitor-like protein [Bryobacteraceae bacterium]
MAFKLTVKGFAEQATIPRRFTCDGEDISPALTWSGEPARTRSFGLILDDPDAPSGTFTHWLLWDIPAQIHSLAEGDSIGRPGTNDFGKRGYGGPCPPRGKAHRYFFRLYALDAPLDVPAGARRAALEASLKPHVLGAAEYAGRYQREG